ncbi:AlpA family phage regulatory protein [Zoogloea oleivorans]|uniref:AlpA family phage regulatory protein n=1 Tax=Zoogloea oleivorans TaxID=1552750 RepID=A0A6C2CRK0_9RHOO|nr:AlpA family phage regulatory protein [Zoogloea oleivorans]TYC56169.1 AlpA family phage regulatory protein [Zoogloea oleivorans]
MKTQNTCIKVAPHNAIKAFPTPATASIPAALENFDALPGAANVRLPVVAALFACSPATVWRRVKKGTLPAPRKLSEGVTAWRVAELRKALSGEAWQ